MVWLCVAILKQSSRQNTSSAQAEVIIVLKLTKKQQKTPTWDAVYLKHGLFYLNQD